MNYLGHLFLSDNDTSLMVANLYGDFVKGKDLSEYPPKVREGITLHRAIDHFIDTHPVVLNLLHDLYPQLPKVAGIAVDLYFDHLLAKYWNNYHTRPLDEFLADFYLNATYKLPEFSVDFQKMMHMLIEVNWISYYPTLDGLEKACRGVSSRISFPNELKNGVRFFLEHEEKILTAFELFMKDAVDYFNIRNSK